MNREMIGEFLLSDGFQGGGIVILSALISIIAKKVSRNDRHQVNNWNDYAFGLDVTISTSILVITRSIDRMSGLYQLEDNLNPNKVFATELASDFWFLFITTITIWLVAQIIRKWGWKNGNDLNSIGVLVPDFIGVLLLYYVMNEFF